MGDCRLQISWTFSLDKVLVGCDEDRLWLKVVNKAWTELHLCTAVHLLLEQLAAKTGGRILLPISLLLPASKLHLTDPRMGSGALEGTLATGDLTPAGWTHFAWLETSAFTGLVGGCLSLRSLRPGGAHCWEECWEDLAFWSQKWHLGTDFGVLDHGGLPGWPNISIGAPFMVMSGMLCFKVGSTASSTDDCSSSDGSTACLCWFLLCPALQTHANS